MVSELVLKKRQYCKTYYDKHKELCRKKAREAYHKKKTEWLYKEEPQVKKNLFRKDIKTTIFIFQ